MLRAMLANRFQLETHRETRTIEVYPIGVARSGFKLKPVAGECHDDQTEQHPEGPALPSGGHERGLV